MEWACWENHLDKEWNDCLNTIEQETMQQQKQQLPSNLSFIVLDNYIMF